MNHQRTSTRNGILKADAVEQAAQVLVRDERVVHEPQSGDPNVTKDESNVGHPELDDCWNIEDVGFALRWLGVLGADDSADAAWRGDRRRLAMACDGADKTRGDGMGSRSSAGGRGGSVARGSWPGARSSRTSPMSTASQSDPSLRRYWRRR
jgi:hypothetical protein